MKVGVLALQGDFDQHQQMLQSCQVESILVKTSSELNLCDQLIIPGGESTTLIKLLQRNQMIEALKNFAQEKAIFGTCAGMILLSQKVTDHSIEPLGLIDLEVQRNAYGRQIDSFVDSIEADLSGGQERIKIEGVFIRAPKIKSMGAGVHALAWHKGEVVMARSKNILVAAFHPELSGDLKVHQYFLGMMKK